MAEGTSLNANSQPSLQQKDHVFDLAVKGDAEALDRLFAPCLTRLQRVAARVLYNPQDSEDALQDGLLSAFRHLKQFRGHSQFTSWVHTIVANAARSQLRKRRKSPAIFSLDDPLSDHHDLSLADFIADPRPRVDENLEQAEKSHVLSEMSRKLPPDWRTVMVLHNIEGLNMKEIAARLGISVSAAKTRHFRASHRILEMVKDLPSPQKVPSRNGARAPKRPDARLRTSRARNNGHRSKAFIGSLRRPSLQYSSAQQTTSRAR